MTCVTWAVTDNLDCAVQLHVVPKSLLVLIVAILLDIAIIICEFQETFENDCFERKVAISLCLCIFNTFLFSIIFLASPCLPVSSLCPMRPVLRSVQAGCAAARMRSSAAYLSPRPPTCRTSTLGRWHGCSPQRPICPGGGSCSQLVLDGPCAAVVHHCSLRSPSLTHHAQWSRL